jgi:uncharacterized membrane protein YebE (DUF533 family)
MKFDATALLGAMTESLRAPSAGQRMDAALRAGASAPANPLQSVLAALQQGGGAGAAAGGLGGLLGQIGPLAERAFGGTAREVRANNPVAVGGLGALAGALLGGGRGAAGGGLLAALGSLAVAAMQNAGRPAAVPVPDTVEDMHGTAMLVLRAMIEAAKADGQVDSAEMQRILRQLESAGADSEARHWVLEQLGAPSDLAGLVAAVTSPEQAMQVYAAALMAIEVDTPAERAFLERLATQLDLPPEAVAHARRALGLTA